MTNSASAKRRKKKHRKQKIETLYQVEDDLVANWKKRTYSYSQKYFAFLKYINFKEKMLGEGIILKYFLYIYIYILINITRGSQK